MADERVTVTMRGRVADVRMVREDKLNALDNAMFEALVETAERLKGDRNVRAVVLSGRGRAFCAGLDTANFQTMASGERQAGSRVIAAVRTPGGLSSGVNCLCR